MTTPSPPPPTLSGGRESGGTGTATGGWLPSARGRHGRRAAAAALVALVGVVGGLSAAALGTTLAQPPPAAAPDPLPAAPPADPQPTADPEAVAEREAARSATNRWAPSDAEAYPNAKRLAARVVERLTTYQPGATPSTRAGRVARRFGAERGDLMGAARELVRPAASSVGVVVYPQLGGLAPTTSSVMVVVDQELQEAGRRWTERRTVDVRLRLVDGQWALDRLGSGGGVPVEAPDDLSAAARAVLAHDRIELTDSARWDIYVGRVDDRLLSLMGSMADRHDIAVATLATGHPPNVWSTDRTSNHTRGRAVDIFSVDGELVVEQQEKRSAAHRLTRWLFKQGVPELGSPWALDGSGGRSFTDAVHADHIHVAV